MVEVTLNVEFVTRSVSFREESTTPFTRRVLLTDVPRVKDNWYFLQNFNLFYSYLSREMAVWHTKDLVNSPCPRPLPPTCYTYLHRDIQRTLQTKLSTSLTSVKICHYKTLWDNSLHIDKNSTRDIVDATDAQPHQSIRSHPHCNSYFYIIFNNARLPTYATSKRRKKMIRNIIIFITNFKS